MKIKIFGYVISIGKEVPEVPPPPPALPMEHMVSQVTKTLEDIANDIRRFEISIMVDDLINECNRKHYG